MKSINLQRTQSLLEELIPEALSQLDDYRINSLVITAVDCKRGKHNATVYFDATDFNKQEIKEIKKALKKVNGMIKSYCLSVTGWYRCPNFDFVEDNMLQKTKKLEELFEQISKEKEGKC